MTPRSTLRPLASVLAVFALAVGCSGGGDDSSTSTPSVTDGELTQVELEQGLGPIRDLDLGPIDPTLAETGAGLFQANCSPCHRLDDRLVGPRLGTVLARRRPEFVMNMILNSEEMVERHPVVKELFAQFLTPMLTQVSEEPDARAILEYLRSAQIDSAGGPGS